MNYLEVANSNTMFLLCGLTILVVFLQAIIFIAKAYSRGKELGLTQEVMKKSMTNSAIFSVVPSLPIIVMYLALSVPLGQYFPWLRLSVVGSAVYEGMGANVAAQSQGLVDISDPGLTPEIFFTIMLVMTIGIIWGIVFNIIFMKKMDTMSKQAKAGGNPFIPIFSGALFCGLLATLSAPYIANTNNPTAIISFVSAALSVLGLNKISKSTNVKIISEFSLPVALIIGMVAAIIAQGFIAV